MLSCHMLLFPKWQKADNAQQQTIHTLAFQVDTPDLLINTGDTVDEVELKLMKYSSNQS